MEDFRVDLGIFLNPENLQTVQSQIDSLSSRNVTLKINTQDVLKDVNLIKQQLKSIGVDFGGATGVSTAVKKEMAEVEKTVSKTTDVVSKELKLAFAKSLGNNVWTSLDGVREKAEETFGKINTIAIGALHNAKDEIKEFTISVKNSFGEIENLRYTLDVEKDDKGKRVVKGYKFDSSRSTDNNIKREEEATRKATQANKEHEAQMRKNEATSIKLQASLDGLKKEYEDLNNARPIRNEDSLKDLGDKYTQITGAVTDLKTAEKDKYDVAKANIESQIKSLKLLIEAYRKAENSGTQLRTKPVEVSKIDEEFKLDAFMAKMQRAGIVAQEFWYKINGVNADGTENQNSLKSKLGAITDTDSLNAYLNLLSNVQAEGKKLIEQKRVNDQQAAQSQENINKVFQRTLELEKQIGQTRVKIAGLDPEKDGAQIAELTNRLNDLKSESQLVKEEFGSTFTTEQVLKLSSVIQETESKIAEVKAQLQDKSAWEQQKQAAKELNQEFDKLQSLRAKISSIELKIKGLDDGKHVEQVKALKVQLSEFEDKYIELYKLLKSENSENTRFNDIKEQVHQTTLKLDELEAKANDVLNKQLTDKSNSIKTNFSNGQYEKEVNAVKTSFDGLRNTTTELQTAMNGLDTAYGNLKTAQAGSDPQKLVVAEEAYINALKKVKNQLDINTRTEREAKAAQTLIDRRNTFISRIDSWLTTNSAAAKKFGNALRELQQQARNADAVQMKHLEAELRNITNQAITAGKSGKSMADRFNESFKTVASYFSASSIIIRSISSIRNGITAIVDLDTALVDLRKTTKATSSELKEFYYNANESAKQLGVTTKDVIQAAADWSRLGYSIKDAETMAKTSSIFASISPNVDISKATDGLVSAMKAFNIEADDALDGIASKINAIGNSQAVSNEDIIEFLTRSSSAMKEANNTLDETIALGTAA